jgi:hypothetical protein
VGDVILAHTNFMGGGHTLLVFVPFLFIGAGLAFISIAAGDRRGRQDRPVRVLPVGAAHPLSHVRASIVSSHKPAREATRHSEQKSEHRRRSGPRWLTPV